MRDPVTATDLMIEEMVEIMIQFLLERDFQETNEAIDANIAASDELLKAYEWPKDAREAEDRLLVAKVRKRNRKRGAPSKRDQNIQIAGAVALLVRETELKPNRSHCGRRHQKPSACSIVARARNQLKKGSVSERTVEDIWYENCPSIIS